MRNVEAAIAATRAQGGIALEPIEVDGRRMVACDDAQGAAFGLLERT
jgi:predicted enzyme related to lactoylglutathione lyase